MDEQKQMLKLHVVEDDVSLRKANEFFMKKNNVSVTSSHNGETAVDEVVTANPDVVLLDLQLPNKSGYDILEELREKGFEKPVVVATNFDRSNIDTERLNAAGVNRILIKVEMRIEDILAEVIYAHTSYKKL
jgi:DNA-binding response OmpR family regulator